MTDYKFMLLYTRRYQPWDAYYCMLLNTMAGQKVPAAPVTTTPQSAAICNHGNITIYRIPGQIRSSSRATLEQLMSKNI